MGSIYSPINKGADKMKIETNNNRHLEVYIDKTQNKIQVYTFDEHNNCENLRCINEVEFIDLYNILVYAQDHNKEIFRL